MVTLRACNHVDNKRNHYLFIQESLCICAGHNVSPPDNYIHTRGMWIRFRPKNLDPGLCTSNWEIFLKILLQKYFRLFQKPSSLSTYFLCQTFQWWPRFRKPAWIRIRIHSMRIRIRIQGSRAYRGLLPGLQRTSSWIRQSKKMRIRINELEV